MIEVQETGRWYPVGPPMLPGESAEAYTDRLTGADRTGGVPYDHARNRQCSIGWHGECSDPSGESCECPCHPERSRRGRPLRAGSRRRLRPRSMARRRLLLGYGTTGAVR